MPSQICDLLWTSTSRAASHCSGATERVYLRVESLRLGLHIIARVMAGWKAYAFVLTFTALHPAFLAGLHIYGRDLRTVSLTYLSLSTIAYIWFLINIAYPFFFSPLNGLPEPPNPGFFIGHGATLVERPAGRTLAKWANEVTNDGIIHFRGFGHLHSRLLLTSP